MSDNGITTLDALLELGFTPVREVVSGHATDFVFDFGNFKLTASELINLQFEEVVYFGGILATPRTSAQIEFEMPRRIQSREQCAAWIVYHLDPAAPHGVFQPAREVAWLAEGRKCQHSLPWNARATVKDAPPGDEAPTKAKPSVSRKLSKDSIICEFAVSVCKRIVRRVIRELQEMTDGLLSGDGSGLDCTWDEVCVQIQYEQSWAWKAYEQTIESSVARHVQELSDHERDAIWLQCQSGEDWDCEDEDSRRPYPVNDADIIEYIVQQQLYDEAGRWSNQRIRDFLDPPAR